ncbi:MAG TPA: adenylyl-sulfate kinase, partial [Methylotenera sp.]|nr:adenylyl-sulfate kinase [Methylotenera sp.]
INLDEKSNIVWQNHKLDKTDRSLQKKQKASVLWFTGLSASGKSTIAGAVEQMLFNLGHHTYLLDGDNVRHGLNKDLGFSDQDRIENIRRIGEMAKLFADAGLIVLSAFISPFRSDRQMVRDLMPEGEFVEIFMSTPLEVCETRDPKGLYQKARRGEIKNFTGIDSAYEQPEQPDIVLNTAECSVEECAQQVIDYLRVHHIIHE